MRLTSTTSATTSFRAVASGSSAAVRSYRAIADVCANAMRVRSAVWRRSNSAQTTHQLDLRLGIAAQAQQFQAWEGFRE